MDFDVVKTRCSTKHCWT